MKTVPRLLIIDDDLHFSKMLALSLESNGDFCVSVENDSHQALAAAREATPDLILCDVMMPGLDGGDVEALLHNDPLLKNTPVIMLTSLLGKDEMGENGLKETGGLNMCSKMADHSNIIVAINSQLYPAISTLV